MTTWCVSGQSCEQNDHPPVSELEACVVLQEFHNGGAKLNLFSASEIGPGVGRSVGWSESAQVCQIGSVGRSHRLGNAKIW